MKEHTEGNQQQRRWCLLDVLQLSRVSSDLTNCLFSLRQFVVVAVVVISGSARNARVKDRAFLAIRIDNYLEK